MDTLNNWNPSLFGTYDHGASFVVEYKDHENNIKFDRYINQACYMPLQRWHMPRGRYEKPVALHCAIVTKPELKNRMDDFLSFLFDPKSSPWKTIIPANGLDWSSPSKVKPYVTIPLTKTTPVQVVFNLAFAVRLGHDIPQIIRRFNWLLEKGWTQHESIFTASYYGLDENGKTVTDDPWSNHNWIDSYRVADFTAIETCKPHLGAHPPVFAEGYSSVTDIWDKKRKLDNEEMYNIKRLEEKYTGTFGSLFNKTYGSANFEKSNTISNEDILALKKEILAVGRK